MARNPKEQINRRCEADEHVAGCQCANCNRPMCNGCPFFTKDHITPQAIAKQRYGWSEKTINARTNIQFLSQPCHNSQYGKDASTPKRLAVLNYQACGGVVDFETHIRLFLGEDYVKKYRGQNGD